MIDFKELNKYVLKVENDEWTFSAEVWPALDQLIQERELRAVVREHRLLHGIFEMVGEPLPELTAKAFNHRTKILESKEKSE